MVPANFSPTGFEDCTNEARVGTRHRGGLVSIQFDGTGIFRISNNTDQFVFVATAQDAVLEMYVLRYLPIAGRCDVGDVMGCYAGGAVPIGRRWKKVGTILPTFQCPDASFCLAHFGRSGRYFEVPEASAGKATARHLMGPSAPGCLEESPE